MIAGIFHEGSGLGDQLFRYITVRTLAEKKGFEFTMDRQSNFKGDFFKDIDLGVKLLGLVMHDTWNEKDTRDENGLDIRSYDPEINFVKDWTVIDGSFEDDKYWRHNLPNIAKWLELEPLTVFDETCVIGFRGGEYAGIPELFLPLEYYEDAKKLMPNKGFDIHTDDFKRAIVYFPNDLVIENEPISHSKHTNMGLNWRAMRYAKHAIIPNSAFFILPRILKHMEDPTAVTIAPRYWARHNTGVWARPACYYPEFTYI